jgi:hypothetical protein
MAVKRNSGRKSRHSRKHSRKHKRSYKGGGETVENMLPKGMGGGTEEGMEPMAHPAAAAAMTGGSSCTPAMAGGNNLSPASISGGGRRRKYKNKSKRNTKRKSSQAGGEGVLATAAVPFGLLALQRYFSGSRKSKNGFRNKSKRTFRRRK